MPSLNERPRSYAGCEEVPDGYGGSKADRSPAPFLASSPMFRCTRISTYVHTWGQLYGIQSPSRNYQTTTLFTFQGEEGQGVISILWDEVAREAVLANVNG
jgi:hypothetical protein